MDNIYLNGSEQVQRAATSMASSADQMQRAAGDFGYHVERLERLWAEISVRLDEAHNETA